MTSQQVDAPPCDSTATPAFSIDPEQTVILCSEQMTTIAASVAELLKVEISAPSHSAISTIDYAMFESNDPNMRIFYQAVQNKHVIFLLAQDDPNTLMRDLAVLQWLQRFVIPEQVQGDKAWKLSVPNGKFEYGVKCASSRVAAKRSMAWVQYDLSYFAVSKLTCGK